MEDNLLFFGLFGWVFFGQKQQFRAKFHLTFRRDLALSLHGHHWSLVALR